MSHVIEHVVDPIGVLREARRHLNPGGIILVRTPNADSWIARLGGRNWSWTCPPIHLWYFTQHSLAIAFERAGVEATAWSHQRGEALPPPLEVGVVLVKSVRGPRAIREDVPALSRRRQAKVRGAISILLQFVSSAWPLGSNHGSDEMTAILREIPAGHAPP
jgi:SAM-dependent methyltransferase